MRRSRIGFAIFFLIAAAAISARAVAIAAEAVDVRLVLAADVSRSIDDDEFVLQRKEYASAITDPRVLEAIAAGHHGAIAVCFVEWAGAGEQRTVVDWTLIASAADATRFAAALTAAPRSAVGRTAIGSAVDYSVGVLGESGFVADRGVIDVSGDGTSNQGRPVAEARDAALALGVTINGLAIFNARAAAEGGYLALHTNPPSGLDKYYRENVIGGAGAFVLRIDGFMDFDRAMIQKLITEISSAAPKSGAG